MTYHGYLFDTILIADGVLPILLELFLVTVCVVFFFFAFNWLLQNSKQQSVKESQ